MFTLLTDHKATLNRLAGLIRDEQACAAQIYAEGSYADDVKKVLDTATATADEKFIVLIIGAFGSGKSSMINTLIGEELLPTGFLPETAVLGELHFGTKKRITLYPKKGKWSGGDAPFDLPKVTVDEIRKYVSLSTDDAINSMEQNDEGRESDARIDAKFEKMVIYWPLDILKDGVVLVDSPGINDPYSNDYIVNDYLPKADAIVYVMSAVNAYQGTDKTQLETINSLGRRNIVTGYTFYDVVEQNTQRNPSRLITVRNRLTNHMLRHTELGAVSIHFLDSMGGLKAKIAHDQEGLRRSGFEGFEEYLGQYLVEGKGTDQVKNMASIITLQADAMIKDAERFNTAAAQDKDEITERIAEAEQRLKTARNDSFQAGRSFRNTLEGYLRDTEKMVRTFLTERLPLAVNLDDFTPETTLPTGLGRLNPIAGRQKAQALQDECQREILRRMNSEYLKWTTNTLNEYLNEAVKKSAEEIKPDLDRLANKLTNITDIAAGYRQTGPNDVKNIAIGVAFGFITGDFLTGSMSAVYGPRTLARAAAYQIGAGIGFGILMAAGAPITLPMVAIATIGINILAILMGNNKDKIDQIKLQAVKDFRQSFGDIQAKNDIDKMVNDVMHNVKEYMNNACLSMEEALAEDIQNTEETIQQIIDNNNLSLSEKQSQISQRNAAVDKLKALQLAARSIADKYGIKEIVKKDVVTTR